MALEIIKNINVDFHDNEYIMVNAKQYDNSSRWIAITCYNQGSIYNLSANKHSAFVKFKRADGKSVLNFCKINYKGEVLVELTEQMLAVGGICYVDLVVIGKGNAMVNIDTGEIIAIDDAPILSTMAFCVNVYESSIDNSEIEYSNEYSALNELLKKVEAEYAEIVKMAKSYAVGGTGTREGEDTDNAKYYNDTCIDVGDKADLARSYAVGGTGTRAGEDTDNAKYYYQVIKNIVDSIDGTFMPMGSIRFSQLKNVAKATGFTYNIIEDFVTDDTFIEGAGYPYAAGTNVYYTKDGYWDALGGSVSSAASVDEVKNYLGL